VVFSGDTAASDNVVRLAHGADLLVHEVIDIDSYERFLGLPPALLEHLRESHTDVTELGPLAERADVDTLVLTHLVPADPLLVSGDATSAGATAGGCWWATTCSTSGYTGPRIISGDSRPARRRRPHGRTTVAGRAGTPIRLGQDRLEPTPSTDHRAAGRSRIGVVVPRAACRCPPSISERSASAK
jgi:hypothetical protein